MNHYYRVVTFLLCFMVFNSWGETPLLIEEDLFTTCTYRMASNTTRCMNDSYHNTQYGGYILLRGIENYYKLENGRFQEFLDGTAQLTGIWVNIDRGDVKFDVDIRFSGRTTTAPNDPKTHQCLNTNTNTNNFYYYTQTSGILKGRNAVAGSRIEVARVGEAFQVGVGANITHNELTFGASGWLTMTVIAQPTTGINLELQTSTTGGNGDININLDGNATACFGSDITLNCPNDITTLAQLGANGKVVTWTPPVATTTCGQSETLGQVEITQITGPAPGSEFPIGMTKVKYKAIDECGNMKMCSFDIVIESTPLMFDLLCADDIIVTATVGDNGAVVAFNDPSILSNCPADGFTVTMTAGLPSGSLFPVGTTTVTFSVADGCGQSDNCSFKVTVNPAPTGEIFLTCAEDQIITIGGDVSTTIVEYDEPIAITSCELDGLNVILIEGLPSGSAFPIGANTVVYEATDACGEVERCSLIITVVESDPCDNIMNGGTIEADEDSEACGPYDAATITNVELPSGGSGDIEYIWLASTVACPTELTDIIPGANDSNYDPGVLRETTYFVRCARRVSCDVWIESDCVVKKIDACDNNDLVDCDAITATVSEGKIIVDGLIGSNAKVEIIGAGTGWTPTLVCGDGGTACENPQTIMNLPEGDYTVKIQLWGADGSYCYTERKVTVTGGESVCDVDGGTIATNDDTTDLCVSDNEPNIVSFSVTGSNGTNRAWVVTDNNGIILNADAPSSIDFEGAGAGTCYVYYVRYENISGLETGANIEALDGCFDKSNRIEVSRTDNCGGDEEPVCEEVVITTGNGKINLVGLSAPFVVVKIHDTNAAWSIIEQCISCEDPTTFNVPAGAYNVVVEFYRGFWNDKYCRRDVRVIVTEGDDSCEDKDQDGICVADDCNDDDAGVGAKQNPGTSCDDGNTLTINDVIQADGCACAGKEEMTPEKEICIEREVFNTDNCQFNIIYGLYLKLEGYDEYYEVSDASFVEYTDGTALYTATAINNTNPNIGWSIVVNFGGRTTLAAVAPKQHNCLAADVNEFYFYETLTGKLTGINDAIGASMDITRVGPAFQLGIAANITHNDYDFGGGGWFVADMLTQPTNGLEIVLNAGAQGQNGDININLSGDETECIDDRDNSELDCGNVAAIATADGIIISGLTAPIEIVKVFDASWMPVENCTGDCGESMTVAAVPGNYVIRVNFYTANWIGKCEVDIPVTVPTNANSAATTSRNATPLTINTNLAPIAVFPNPAKEEIFVNLTTYVGKTANIQVVNTYGQVVQEVAIDEIPTQAIRLVVSNFQTGLYHLSIQVDNSNIITKKVMVNRQY